MSDETTPAGIELVLADLSQRTERAEAEAAKLRGWDESLSGRMAKDLDDAKARAEKAEVALDAVEDLTSRLREDHRAELAEAEKQIRTAGAERDKFCAAFTAATERQSKAEAELQRIRGARFLADNLLQKIDVTREALAALDQAITASEAHGDMAGVREAFDELVTILDLPEEGCA